MKVGDRVEVVWRGSRFFGKRGYVRSLTPAVMVVLDDDPRPIFFGDGVVVVTDEGHHGGAE